MLSEGGQQRTLVVALETSLEAITLGDGEGALTEPGVRATRAVTTARSTAPRWSLDRSVRRRRARPRGSTSSPSSAAPVSTASPTCRLQPDSSIAATIASRSWGLPWFTGTSISSRRRQVTPPHGGGNRRPHEGDAPRCAQRTPASSSSPTDALRAQRRTARSRVHMVEWVRRQRAAAVHSGRWSAGAAVRLARRDPAHPRPARAAAPRLRRVRGALLPARGVFVRRRGSVPTVGEPALFSRVEASALKRRTRNSAPCYGFQAPDG